MIFFNVMLDYVSSHISNESKEFAPLSIRIKILAFIPQSKYAAYSNKIKIFDRLYFSYAMIFQH